MGRHPFAQDQEFLHSQALADLGTGLAADDDRFDPRQSPSKYWGYCRKSSSQTTAPRIASPRNSKPFVGSQAVLRPRGVRQRSLEQLFVGKRIADPLFTTLQ